MSISRALTIMPVRALSTKVPQPAAAAVAERSQNDQKAGHVLARVSSLFIWTRRSSSSSLTKGPGKSDVDKAEVSGQTSVNKNKDGVGFKSETYSRDIFLNPLLTPPPRSPKTAEDFGDPSKLGHWQPIGLDYFNPFWDKDLFHELLFFTIVGSLAVIWVWAYAPDYKDRDWARREAFLRTHKREALGLPLIDPNLIDPSRIVLPTEEELGDFLVTQ